MTPDIRREARLFQLIAAIVGGYVVMVTGTALAWDQADLLLTPKGVKAVAVIWFSAAAIVFSLYAIDLLFRRRPARPLLAMAEDFRAHVLRADWAFARAGVVVGFGALLLFFNTFKSMIANVRGFPFDHLLRDADKLLFLGHDPWRLTHSVIGPYGTATLEFAYGLWFVMMWISLIYLILRPELVRFRAQYLTAFLLTWILVGSIGAWVFASAGPVFFNTFKSMIANVRGFPFDHLLRDADKLLFLGHDPWRLTHSVIGPYGTATLEFAYGLWFVMMWISLIYLILRPELVRFRAQYLTAFLLTWILVGSIGAWVFASAGPVFFERAFGDPYFAELMTSLKGLDGQMRALGLGGVDSHVSEALWRAYANRDDFFGGGISAMPSIHVAISATMAFAAYRLNRRVGHAVALFAVTIWVASVHLAWHYALDGVVGALMAYGIWRMSGVLIDRFVLTESRDSALAAA